MESAAFCRFEPSDFNLDTASKSVLIVEDDISVVEFVEHVLDVLRPDLDWDYATSAEAALEKIRDRDKKSGEPPFNLVIADIFLNGELTGFDLWLECARKYPDMHIVITSSLSAERYFSILSGFDHFPTFLPKPLTVGGCRSVLEEFV